jgi:hypothetical protein
MIKKPIKHFLYWTLGAAIIVLAALVYLGKMVVDADKDIERDLKTACNASIGAPPSSKLISLLERVESGGIFDASEPKDEEKLAHWWRCMRTPQSSIGKCGKVTATFNVMVSASTQSLISAEMEIAEGILKKCSASVGPGPSY